MSFFSSDYYDARDKFLTLAKEKKGKIFSFQNPKGEKLFLDVAIFGNFSAKKAYLNISGVHGVEGFAGSAYQIGFISKYLDSVDLKNIKLIFVHALNPFGFCHLQRENEDNIDLNRNFLRSWEKIPLNPGFDKLHSLLKKIDPDRKNVKEIKTVERLQKYHTKKFEHALYKGQYRYPDGLFYGGEKPSWSFLTLKYILDEHCKKVKKVSYLDIHTGYGKYLNAELYSFGKESGCCHKRVRESFSDIVRVIPEPYPVNGSLLAWARRYFKNKDFLGGSVEFGTASPSALKYLCFDSFIKFNPNFTRKTKEENKEKLKKALFPDSNNWRQLTSGICLKIMNRGIAWLN